MLLVALKAPALTPALLSVVGEATGLSAADIRPRMSGPGPWVLAVSATAEPLTAMLPLLAQLHVQALVCDPSVVPGDNDRVIVRNLAFGPSQLVATDGTGVEHACDYSAISLIQQGNRVHTNVETTKTTQRKFSAGRALLTGGLSLTKKEVITETKKTESSERFVLLSRNDGEPDLMLYERRLNYQFLGNQMQFSSFANLQSLIATITAKTTAVVDDRVNTPGFVGRLPKTRTDPADLALYLVQLAHAGF